MCLVGKFCHTPTIFKVCLCACTCVWSSECVLLCMHVYFSNLKFFYVYDHQERNNKRHLISLKIFIKDITFERFISKCVHTFTRSCRIHGNISTYSCTLSQTILSLSLTPYLPLSVPLRQYYHSYPFISLSLSLYIPLFFFSLSSFEGNFFKKKKQEKKKKINFSTQNSSRNQISFKIYFHILQKKHDQKQNINSNTFCFIYFKIFFYF